MINIACACEDAAVGTGGAGVASFVRAPARPASRPHSACCTADLGPEEQCVRRTIPARDSHRFGTACDPDAHREPSEDVLTPPNEEIIVSQPTPDQTPQGPAYQGRLLPRPDDEVVDQGLSFDVRTLLTRRRMFRVVGLGAGAFALAACSTDTVTGTSSTAAAATTTGSSTAAGFTTSSGSTSSDATSAADSSTSSAASSTSGDLTEIPDETAGPYPGDGSNGPDVLEESGIVRQDIRSSFGTSTTTAEGVPLTFEFTVLDMASGGSPFAGVAVYAWHCDRDGNYSMYSSGIEDENYLRGVQIADANGKVSFTSIFPACYSGRWPHIHFEVYPDEASISDSANAIATSQMALPQNVCETVYATTGYEQSVTNLSQITLQSDNVFGDDAGIHQIGTVSGDVTSGYTASLTAPVDTTTTPSAGSAPSGGGGGGMGGGPGGGGTPPTGG
ncbi:3,4-dioxygenase subunit beta [Nakamurella sp. YIM 132087]|uniref:3,4-dioxygenase subunit beta n=1 Tax=Nakamurella alba TaxID=2665158 RepID=A0A7K1FIV4_9ACTN|nr:3,4-dioxygenase subunit beta [Nakamurella alba]